LSSTAPFERGAADEAAHGLPRRLRKAASLGDEMRARNCVIDMAF
jgi:hypothetical protein